MKAVPLHVMQRSFIITKKHKTHKKPIHVYFLKFDDHPINLTQLSVPH